MSKYIVEMKNITKRFPGIVANNNVTIQIKKGEKIALMAPSGQGKTTLLRLICGLEKADRGSLSVEGKISVVFQEDRLFEGFSVYENVYSVCRNPQISEEVLRGVLLWEERDKLPTQLSGGMARRVAIARALAFCHDILILDEPFKGLDEETKRTVAEFIKGREEDKTLLFITHDREEAALLEAEIICIG
jgi:NitT/TauT family transport system ATP-binding protein